MTINVLFLCPHAAAKSVAAAGYLAGATQNLDVELSIRNAGTHPDAQVLPLVSSRLEVAGLPVAGTPRLVTSDDLDEADVVINIGCDLADWSAGLSEEKVEDWAIPNFSDDPAAAFSAIKTHVAHLADRIIS